MGKLLQRLRDPARSGVYRVQGDEELGDALKAGAPALVRIDLGQPVFEAFSRALAFPEWFGRNWDALEDCLTDLSWRDSDADVLLLERWQRTSEDERALLLEVLGAAAEFWSGKHRPFFAVFLDPQGRLPLPELFRRK